MATLVKLHRNTDGEEFVFNLDFAIEIRPSAKGGALVSFGKGSEARNLIVRETVDEVYARWSAANGGG